MGRINFESNVESDDGVDDEVIDKAQTAEDESAELDADDIEAEEESTESNDAANDTDAENTDESIQASTDNAGDKSGQAADVLTIELDGEESKVDENESPVINSIRKRMRELEKENKKLKRQVEHGGSNDDGLPPLPKEPELDDPDIDYDTQVFKQKLLAWEEAKRKHAEAAKIRDDEETAANEAWQKRLDHYGKLKAELKVPDYEEAESTVIDTLSQVQQAIIVKAAQNPAIVILALGKHEAKLKELAAIKDPIDFALAIKDLEDKKLKVTKRPAPPPPEKAITGKGGSVRGGAVDSQRERLRADAERTGDYTKLHAYNRQQRQKGR